MQDVISILKKIICPEQHHIIHDNNEKRNDNSLQKSECSNEKSLDINIDLSISSSINLLNNIESSKTSTLQHQNSVQSNMMNNLSNTLIKTDLSNDSFDSTLSTLNKINNIIIDKLIAVIIKNHGVVTVGSNIHQSRAVVEALEEWAKILTISKIFGGPKYVLEK